MATCQEIETKELSQEEADCLMKSLSGKPLQNFKEAFHDERRKTDLRQSWALPPIERVYFLASLKEKPYLLIGIHPDPLPSAPHILNISSLARIADAPKGYAVDCMRAIIEEKLVPLCKQRSKRLMMTRIHTEGGFKVFEALRSETPNGIANLSIERTRPDWSCTMEMGDRKLATNVLNERDVGDCEIPRQMRRRALMEAGHVCAVCGSEAGVEVHHIIPHARVKTHELENLIALCPNCHHRAHRGDIDRKALAQYKTKPYITRRGRTRELEDSTIQQSISGKGNIAIGQVTGGTVTIKPEAGFRQRVKAISAPMDTTAYYPLLREHLHERIDQLAKYRLQDNLNGIRTQARVRGKIFRDFNQHFGIEQFQLLRVQDFDKAMAWIEEKVRKTRYGRINQKRSRDHLGWQIMRGQVLELANQLKWSNNELSEEIHRTCGVTSIDQVTRTRLPLLILHLKQRAAATEIQGR